MSVTKPHWKIAVDERAGHKTSIFMTIIVIKLNQCVYIGTNGNIPKFSSSISVVLMPRTTGTQLIIGVLVTTQNTK